MRRSAPSRRSVMQLERFYEEDLTQASYLVGCEATGEALVVDPNLDLERYVEAAERAGLRISAVAETHIHADFVSGARALAERTGARLYLSGAGPAEWQYTFPLPPGQEAGAAAPLPPGPLDAGAAGAGVPSLPHHSPLPSAEADAAASPLPAGRVPAAAGAVGGGVRLLRDGDSFQVGQI